MREVGSNVTVGYLLQECSANNVLFESTANQEVFQIFVETLHYIS